MRCIVVGAGIGGVALTIALRRAGIEPVVYERSEAPREVGAGIVLWGNAIAALRAIGAAESVLARGAIMREGELRSSDGRVLSSQRVEEWDRELGESSAVFHRAELLDALLSNVPRAAIRFGRECVGVRASADRVTVRFADGVEEDGDLVIGADGIRSCVRASLFDEPPLRYAGYTCWRAIAEAPSELVPPGYLCETWGRGQRFGWLSIARGRVYWFATVDAPPAQREARDEAARHASGEAALAELARRFGDWWGPVPALLAATEPARLLHNDILDRPPRRDFGLGRVTLLGDAAHPTTPNIGQGACLAIEDAVLLARELARARESKELEAALRRYERARRARTAEIVRFSWWLGRVGQWSHPVSCWLRDRAMAATPMAAIRRQHARYVGYRVH